jgi:hypothetical protein
LPNQSDEDFLRTLPTWDLIINLIMPRNVRRIKNAELLNGPL